MISRYHVLAAVFVLLGPGCSSDKKADDAKAPAGAAPSDLSREPEPTPPSSDAGTPAGAVPAGFRGVVIREEGVIFEGRTVATASRIVADRTELVALLSRAGHGVKYEGRLSKRGLLFLVEPESRADVVLSAVRSALEAGIEVIEIAKLGEMDGDHPKVLCQIPAAPPVAKDAVVLSVTITRDRTWVGQSIVKGYEELKPPYTEVVEALSRQRDDSHFIDRKDAELAVEPGVTTAAMLPILVPLCERFPAIRPLTIAELAAPPPDL